LSESNDLGRRDIADAEIVRDPQSGHVHHSQTASLQPNANIGREHGNALSSECLDCLTHRVVGADDRSASLAPDTGDQSGFPVCTENGAATGAGKGDDMRPQRCEVGLGDHLSFVRDSISVHVVDHILVGLMGPPSPKLQQMPGFDPEEGRPVGWVPFDLPLLVDGGSDVLGYSIDPRSPYRRRTNDSHRPPMRRSTLHKHPGVNHFTDERPYTHLNGVNRRAAEFLLATICGQAVNDRARL
jgi:hypothetical protein